MENFKKDARFLFSECCNRRKRERRKQVFPVFVLYKHQEDEESRFDNPKFVFVKETKKAVKLFLLNCLIFKVDQLGLEPRTSRL